MFCNYCGQDAIEASGMYDSSEDSPEVTFWHCQDCQHAWMDESQESEINEKLARVWKCCGARWAKSVLNCFRCGKEQKLKEQAP